MPNGFDPTPVPVMCSYCLRPREQTGPLVSSPIAAICKDCAQSALQLFARAPARENYSPTTLPWNDLSDYELMARLPEIASAGSQVERHLQAWVDAARQRDISWAKIGQALGMTRQSAWERFKQ